KQCQPGFPRRGDKAESQRLVSAQAAVEARCKVSGRDLVADLEGFGGFAVRIAALQRELVGFHEQRLILELVFDPADRRLRGTVVKPVAHAQGEEILAAIHGLGVETQMLEGAAREPLELDGEKPEL